jgi:hypothetical protein
MPQGEQKAKYLPMLRPERPSIKPFASTNALTSVDLSSDQG